MAEKNILICDDEPDMADFLMMALESEGYKVQTAASADSVIAKLKDFPADLILLDMGMPGLNADTPARDIRNRTRTKAKILIMTGRDLEHEKKGKGLDGADGALQKGTGMDAIVSKVKDFLS